MASKAGNGNGPHGRIRSHGHYSGYYMLRYPRNKLKRILRNNGYPAARSWADKHEVAGILLALVNSGAKVREER